MHFRKGHLETRHHIHEQWYVNQDHQSVNSRQSIRHDLLEKFLLCPDLIYSRPQVGSFKAKQYSEAQDHGPVHFRVEKGVLDAFRRWRRLLLRLLLLQLGHVGSLVHKEHTLVNVSFSWRVDCLEIRG